MRIVNQPIPGITKAYKQQNKENGVAQMEGPAKQDEINISHEARFFNTARSALKQLPEANEKKIAELRTAIKTGTYEVKSEELAEKIWQESFLDQRI
ncbi:MAG TPA: flagellar biosynthesis anti-sigma factor FlgM [Clostridia bacterium]|nr:flagellar biosynthesis anti-sigma factor FlgM [Clostridia bacterium]